MIKSITSTQRPKVFRKKGFTMIEALVALAIMSLIMIGTMNLFIGSLRMAARTTAEVFASQDASRAVRHTMDITREALWFALPDSNDAIDQTVTPNKLYFTEELATVPGMASYAPSNFISTDSSGNNTCDTAMYIAFPAGDATEKFSVNSTNANMAPAYPLYNRSVNSASYLMLYRANKDGSPNAASGTYLWEVGYDGGVAVNQALVSSLDTAWNAMQFVRPTWASSTTVIPYEVEVKITSAYFSPINGVQTSDATNGTNTTQLIGKCVAMRNHELNGVHEPGSNQTIQGGNRFKAS